MQAAIDIAGPGFANIAYNIISYGNLRYELDYIEYLLSEDFEKLTIVSGKLGCTLTFFRSILNEYTTGICVLTSSFFRYCLICHPTADISSAVNIKRLSLAMVVAILIVLMLNIWDMAARGRSTSVISNSNLLEGVSKFVWNCRYFIYRNNVQRPILYRDVAIFFFVPAAISAIFYLRVFKVLRGRERNQNRNRNLVVAFVLNWVLWVICWSIYYTTMSLNLGYKTMSKLNSERTVFDVMKERLASSKEIFCLLYSQLNPVFFLIILKPLQNKFLIALKLTISSTEHSYRVLANHQKHHQKQNRKPEKAKQEKGLVKKKLRNFCSTLLLLAAGLLAFNAIIWDEVKTSLTHTKEDGFFSRIQARMVQRRQVPNFLVLQDVFSAEFEDPRIKCGVLNGSVSMQNRRCYFSANQKQWKSWNLTEQVEFCLSQNSTLAYPRTFNEAGFLFRYYLFECGLNCRRNVTFGQNRWFIRLGFQRKLSEIWSGFSTFDDKLVIQINERSVFGGNSSLNGSVIDYDYDYDYDYDTEYDDYDYYDYDYAYEYAKVYSKFSVKDLTSFKMIST